jgi:hypothetical protein
MTCDLYLVIVKLATNIVFVGGQLVRNVSLSWLTSRQHTLFLYACHIVAPTSVVSIVTPVWIVIEILIATPAYLGGVGGG